VKAAFVIFNSMTALDFVGVDDPVTRLKSIGLMPDLCDSRGERVVDEGDV
jgi:hypothetical protein